jgi:hypothetical protein
MTNQEGGSMVDSKGKVGHTKSIVLGLMEQHGRDSRTLAEYAAHRDEWKAQAQTFAKRVQKQNDIIAQMVAALELARYHVEMESHPAAYETLKHIDAALKKATEGEGRVND